MVFIYLIHFAIFFLFNIIFGGQDFRPDSGIKYVLWYQHSTTTKFLMSTNGKSYVLSSPVQKLSKLFNQRGKLFGGIIKLSECLQMPTICFSQCPSKNIDITTLLGHSGYQTLKYFAKYFTCTGGMICSKYLYSKCTLNFFLRECYL